MSLTYLMLLVSKGHTKKITWPELLLWCMAALGRYGVRITQTAPREVIEEIESLKGVLPLMKQEGVLDFTVAVQQLLLAYEKDLPMGRKLQVLFNFLAARIEREWAQLGQSFRDSGDGTTFEKQKREKFEPLVSLLGVDPTMISSQRVDLE